MQIHLTGKHVEITPALRTHIANKIAKLEDTFPRVKRVTVIVTVEKYRHTVEIHFNAEGVELSAKKTTKDMYASVEEAVSALEQQASKRKDRLHTSSALRRSAGRVERLTERATAKSRKAASDADDNGGKIKIVRVRGGSAKPMAPEDAVALMEATGQAFVLFRDARTEAIQLLYRRDDGAYALVEA